MGRYEDLFVYLSLCVGAKGARNVGRLNFAQFLTLQAARLGRFHLAKRFLRFGDGTEEFRNKQLIPFWDMVYLHEFLLLASPEKNDENILKLVR